MTLKAVRAPARLLQTKVKAGPVISSWHDLIAYCTAQIAYIPRSSVCCPSDTGIGPGFYISRLIVEQHGDALEIESTVGVGTTVTVMIPAQDATEG